MPLGISLTRGTCAASNNVARWSRVHDCVPTPMRMKIVMCLLCTTVLVASISARGQPSAPSTSELLARFGTAPNGVARYEYRTSVMPLLTGDDKSLAEQLLATVDSELGLYNEA